MAFTFFPLKIEDLSPKLVLYSISAIALRADES